MGISLCGFDDNVIFDDAGYCGEEVLCKADLQHEDTGRGMDRNIGAENLDELAERRARAASQVEGVLQAGGNADGAGRSLTTTICPPLHGHTIN
jgi:hypothetical protein